MRTFDLTKSTARKKPEDYVHPEYYAAGLTTIQKLQCDVRDACNLGGSITFLFWLYA